MIDGFEWIQGDVPNSLNFDPVNSIRKLRWMTDLNEYKKINQKFEFESS